LDLASELGEKNTFELVEGSIEVINVGLVVFFVMEFKEFTAEDGFKVGVAVLEFGQSDFGALTGKPHKYLSG
jgi:hypothetical protein